MRQNIPHLPYHLISQPTTILITTVLLLHTIPPDFIFIIVNIPRWHNCFIPSLDSIINLGSKSNRKQQPIISPYPQGKLN